MHNHYIQDNSDDLDSTHFADVATSPLTVLTALKTGSAVVNSVEDFVYDKTASVKAKVDYWIDRFNEFKI